MEGVTSVGHAIRASRFSDMGEKVSHLKPLLKLNADCPDGGRVNK